MRKVGGVLTRSSPRLQVAVPDRAEKRADGRRRQAGREEEGEGGDVPPRLCEVLFGNLNSIWSILLGRFRMGISSNANWESHRSFALDSSLEPS